MANIFQEVMNDVSAVEEKYLGPTYPYWKNIKTPSQLGMSDNGSLSTLARDIDGLVQYVEVLVTGDSNASATGRPLGNKFFLKTGGKCLDVNSCSDPSKPSSDTCNAVDRYIYVDNVPNGNIPFISSGLGVNFSEFRGLIPGTVSNLNALNPYTILQSFMAGSQPPCKEVTLQTITTDNQVGSATHFVTTVDIDNMNAVNNRTEAFENEVSPSLPEDPFVQIYYALLSILGLYVLYRLIAKHSKKIQL
jgi:hypothetical protein